MKWLLALCFFGAVLFAEEPHFVTCQFKGQVGNQMFQIATAVAYALDHNYEARFPSVFQAEHGEDNFRFFLHRVNTTPFPRRTRFEEFKELHYATYIPLPEFAGKNIRIDGHFVSEKYFAHHAEVIRNLFAPSREIRDQIEQKYRAFARDRTVAVHVRTFIPDGRNMDDFKPGSKCWWYFIDAMKIFPESSHFLVFSDRIDVVKKYFPNTGLKVTFIEGNPYYIDFYLISRCDHQIISPGSTYSWWAAWLNPNPDKIVIVSHVWSNLAKDDAIPESWIRVKAWGAND